MDVWSAQAPRNLWPLLYKNCKLKLFHLYFFFKNVFYLLLKFRPSTFSLDCLPLVTLYTKDPCHLCDVLVEQLELNFSGEYVLEKVFIDTKENIRFLRLYRMDIPVVFFNNQFLCMHRLNHRLLRRKLDLLKTL